MKRLHAVLVVSLVVGVAIGSFFATRALWPGGAAETGAEPPIPDFESLDRLIEEDRAKPRFNGVINGIRIYDPDTGPESQGLCTSAEAQWVSADLAKGSPLDIQPSYLPPGTVEQEAIAVQCNNGVLSSVERLYGGPAGIYRITRFAGEQAMSISAPVDRIEATTIAGKNAVLIEPVFPLHPTHIAVAEQFGVTTTDGTDADTLIKILESLQ